VLNWPIPVLVIIAIIIFCIGWLKAFTNSKKKTKLGIIFMSLAIIIIVGAGILLIYNNKEETRVTNYNESLVTEFEKEMEKYSELNDEGQVEKDLSWLDYNNSIGTEYSKTLDDGVTYIGILYFPEISNLAVPVIDNCTDSNLKLSACRYSGSLNEKMIIAGHSYKSIFGKLSSKLKVDNIIYFKSLDGNVYKYKLVNIEYLLPTDVQKMQSGEWDLTIFTCTYDNQKRITYRFILDD
jgi:sortase A